MLPGGHLDLSSIRGETPEGTYLQPLSQANLTQQQISPLIKAEIQQQINLGMQQFFQNLDQKKKSKTSKKTHQSPSKIKI